jgi:hypothetical protein
MRDRTIKLQVWLSEHEAYLLERKSKDCKMSHSSFIRSIINDYEPKAAPPLDYYQVMSELRSVGNNLNQIAHRANAGGDVNADSYGAAAGNLTKITDELMGVFLPQRRR